MKDTERILVEDMYCRFHWRCFVCNERATQRSHIIGNTKLNRKIYGSHIIDSPLNWLPACGLYHNGLIDAGHVSVLPETIAGLIKDNRQVAIEILIYKNICKKTGIKWPVPHTLENPGFHRGKGES